MRRLIATIGLDVRQQQNNGFYYAVAFVLVCWFVILTQLPDVDWGYLLPPIVFGNLTTVNFYFIAGLVLLEKAEGTLEAQVVTPLLDWEYLVSKTLTLAGLSLVEQLIIVTSAYGFGFRIGPLVAGTVLAGVLYTLTGFILAARYDSINEYLFPSVLYVLVLSLPLLHYFELWSGWLPYLHPFTAPLVLMKGAFEPIPAWQWSYGVLYSTLWAGLLLWIDRRVFARFVIAGEGAH